LHGLAADADSQSALGSGLYGPQESAATYAAIERHAAAGIEAGVNVIVDGAFLRRAQRAAFRKLAKRGGARFVVLDCECPEDVLRERIVRRLETKSDASEATTDVLDHQLRHAEPLGEDELRDAVQIDTSRNIDASHIVGLIRGH